MKWEKRKLSEIATTSSGGTPSRSKQEYWNGNIPWIKSGQLKDGYILECDEFITEIGLKNSSASLVKSNTLLLALYGATAGKLAFSNVDAATNQAVCAIITNEKIVNKRYLFYYLLSIRSKILNDASGGAQPNISQAYVKNINVPLPPLHIQEQIADTLDKADALRRKDQELLSKYDELAQAIFYDMFGDPVRNEKGWDIKKLGISCDVGSSVRVFVDELVGDGVPFYRGAEIGKLATNQKVNPELFITNDHYSNLKKQGGVPQIGDLLLPSICSDGRIYEVIDDNPFYFKDGRVLWIKVNKKTYNSTFLRCLLKEVFLRNYSSIASGTTFAELKIFILKNLELIEPPLKQQIDFSSRLAILSSVFLKSNESASLSSNIFNRISTEYFS
jgi:type I restriction enzyme S subunit